MNMGIRITGPAVKNHISSEMARELIAIHQTMYHSWFLLYQRFLPQLRLHRPSSSQESTSENSDSVLENRDVEAPVSERNSGMNEELRVTPVA